MIELDRIPVAPDAGRLAERLGRSRNAAESLLKSTGRLLSAAGVFDEAPVRIFSEPDMTGLPEVWGDTVIIGLAVVRLQEAEPPLEPAELTALKILALGGALDFLQYRVRQYLKPGGRRPGPRLLPGCPDLPLAANRVILRHFAPALGIGLLPSGELNDNGAAAFLHPTVDLDASPGGRCASCSRANCPTRLA